MPYRTPFRRALLGACLAVTLASAAFAGESVRDTTRVEVRLVNGAIETVELADLKPGEVRAVVTENRVPAVVTRTEHGLRLELAGEVFETAMPAVEVDPAHDFAAHAGAHSRRVVVHRHVEHETLEAPGAPTREKTVVVVKRHGDGEALAGLEGLEAVSAVDPLDAESLPSLADPENADRRILVLRRVERTVTRDAVTQ